MKENLEDDMFDISIDSQKQPVGTMKNYTEDELLLLLLCYYCEGVFHYMCIASWISTHNSCPTCQNEFLDPHSPLFEHFEQ